jgi:hypothetical protein
VSFTVTVNEQLAINAAPSVTVQVTSVTPFGKVAPDAGAHTTAFGGRVQLSEAVGAKVTTAAHWFGSVDCVIFAGQVIIGGCVSFTVTVNVHVASGLTLFVAVQLTVVTPLLKVEPEAGTHVTVGVGIPVAVGAGKLTTAVQTPGPAFAD